MKTKLLISLMAIAYSTNASIALAKPTTLVDLTDNPNAVSIANASSDDGSIVVGMLKRNGIERGYIWNQSDPIKLGTFRKDGSGNSDIKGVSADGSVVVGVTDSDRGGGIDKRAFIWKDASTGMQDLGTLRVDGIGTSAAYGISSDGLVVVGEASAGGSTHAFKWRQIEGEGVMQDLGTLNPDNSGNSAARSVSSDGNYIVGASDNNAIAGKKQAFIWHESTGMKGLGPLKGNTNLESDAYDVSVDGATVVGWSNNDKNVQRAFVWHPKSGMQDLGTFKSDNSGKSVARGVSASGITIVGWAQNDDNLQRGFAWRKSIGLFELDSLRSDNGGQSGVNSISSDGTVAVGFAETDNGNNHAVLWKLGKEGEGIYPEPENPDNPDPSPDPEKPSKPSNPDKPVQPSKPVDVNNTYDAMAKTSAYGAQVLDLYSNNLALLRQNRCQLGSNNYCIGTYGQYSSINSSHLGAAGLTLAMRLPVENFVIGATVGYPVWDKLNSGYKAKGSNNPGFGFFARYETSNDGVGFSSEISGSTIHQKINITRQTLDNTEAGKGETQIKGYEFGIKAMYGLKASPNLLISPFVSLVHSQIKRRAYTEDKGADFLASYSNFGYKDNNLNLGVNLRSNFNNKIFVSGSLGVSKRLGGHQDDFVSKIPYMGSFKYESERKRDTRAFAHINAGYKLSKHQVISTSVGWQQTHYSKNAVQANLNYSYSW